MDRAEEQTERLRDVVRLLTSLLLVFGLPLLFPIFTFTKLNYYFKQFLELKKKFIINKNTKINILRKDMVCFSKIPG